MTKDEYHKYLNGNYWRGLAKQTKKLRRHTCERCGAKKPPWQLEVHHKSYARCPYKEWASDLQVLCPECHHFVHFGEKNMGDIEKDLERWLLP